MPCSPTTRCACPASAARLPRSKRAATAHRYRTLCTRRLSSLQVNTAARACIAVLAAVAALSGCERRAEHPALREARLPPLIPAYEFVFNRHAIDGFSFSPDGTRLAWSGPSGLSRALHVRLEATGETHVYKAGG